MLAGGELKIEKDSTVTGDAGTNGDAELQKNATVTGSLTYAGELKLDAAATVGGTLTNGTVTIANHYQRRKTETTSTLNNLGTAKYFYGRIFQRQLFLSSHIYRF